MAKLGEKYISVLDMGSSKIVCFIAKKDIDNNLKIIGIGHNNSEGVKNGVITDIGKAKDSICSAVKSAEVMAKVNINEVVISLNPQILESKIVEARTSVLGKEITSRDIFRLLQNAVDRFGDEDLHIINSIPLSYSLDQTNQISDPRGMHGRNLKADIHLVTSPTSAIVNIASCLAKCHLDIKDFLPAPYASGLTCLSEDEKELGSILIDFGSNCTSVSIFKNNKFVFFDSIPIGGSHVTKDIAIGLSIKIDCAERLKTIYGNVISAPKDSREIIDIPPNSLLEGMSHSDVPKSALIGIIRPRVQEIVEMIKDILDKHHLTNLGNVIVVTGGASQLNGLKTYLGDVFDKNVRIGVASEIEGMAESTKGASFSNASGILSYVLFKRDNIENHYKKFGSKLNNPFVRLYYWLKDNF